MRRRILGVAVVAVIIAELIFAVPLAIAVQRLLVSGQREELEREALRTAVVVSRTPVHRWPGLDLGAESDGSVALYGDGGGRIAGSGPAVADPLVLRAEHGGLAQGSAGDECITGWLKGDDPAVVSAACQKAIDGL